MSAKNNEQEKKRIGKEKGGMGIACMVHIEAIALGSRTKQIRLKAEEEGDMR